LDAGEGDLAVAFEHPEGGGTVAVVLARLGFAELQDLGHQSIP
jgi:hypothetical protein